MNLGRDFFLKVTLLFIDKSLFYFPFRLFAIILCFCILDRFTVCGLLIPIGCEQDEDRGYDCCSHFACIPKHVAKCLPLRSYAVNVGSGQVNDLCVAESKGMLTHYLEARKLGQSRTEGLEEG